MTEHISKTDLHYYSPRNNPDGEPDYRLAENYQPVKQTI